MLIIETVRHPDTVEAWYNRANEVGVPMNLKKAALRKQEGGIIQADCRDGYIVLPDAKEAHETLLAKLYSVQLKEDTMSGDNKERTVAADVREEGGSGREAEVILPRSGWGIESCRGLEWGEKLCWLEAELSNLWAFCIDRAIKCQHGEAVCSLEGFMPLFEQCGLCEEGTRADWIEELGTCRALARDSSGHGEVGMEQKVVLRFQDCSEGMALFREDAGVQGKINAVSVRDFNDVSSDTKKGRIQDDNPNRFQFVGSLKQFIQAVQKEERRSIRFDPVWVWNHCVSLIHAIEF